jgi:hypothetical protein
MGKSRLLDWILIYIANWTVVCAVLQVVLLIIPELFVLPWYMYDQCSAQMDSKGCSGRHEFGAKPNLLTWVAEILLGVPILVSLRQILK